MMYRTLFAASLALTNLSIPSPTFAAESLYTQIDLAHCKTLVEPEPDEPGGDYQSLRCKGWKDYDIIFKEGDLRQSIHFGYLDPKIIEEAFETFGPFNTITNGKVEWRIGDDGRPFAAIFRVTVENVNQESGEPDVTNQGQVLVISRVGQPSHPVGCVIAYVDALANPDPNEIARGLADDTADSFECGKDKADYYGIRGPKAGDPSSNFPEL